MLPKAAITQMRIAVVKLAILVDLSFQMIPAPIKPTPEAIWAATLEGSPPILVEIYVNIKDPNISRTTERIPITLLVFCLSYPRTAPQKINTAKLRKNILNIN